MLCGVEWIKEGFRRCEMNMGVQWFMCSCTTQIVGTCVNLKSSTVHYP